MFWPGSAERGWGHEREHSEPPKPLPQSRDSIPSRRLALRQGAVLRRPFKGRMAAVVAAE